MKAAFVLVGTLFLVSAAALILNKSNNRWSHVLGGMSAILGIILATATPMKNGQLYRIENGHPIPVL
jgi:uncharacterized membrane protein HdeD (DUF308 family)